MSHDGSDVSDEDAVLPAVGVLDDLDSDIDFSDEDDPALQDYSEADEEWKRRQEEAKGDETTAAIGGIGGGGGGGGGEASRSDYSVKSAFWEKLHAPDPEAVEREGLREEQKEEIRRKAAARDQAIMAGQFIPCARFTIPRPGYEFRMAEGPQTPYGPGYYETAERAQEVAQTSPWPAAVAGRLRIGLYAFSV